MKIMSLNVTEVILLNNNKFGENFFRKIRVKTIKCGLKTDKKTDKNRQKPIKLSVPKNKSVGFCRFRNRQNRPTKTDKNRQRGVVGLHPRLRTISTDVVFTTTTTSIFNLLSIIMISTHTVCNTCDTHGPSK
jgi:hypothetical protein